MNAIRMQTLPDLLRLLHETADGRVGRHGVERGDCRLLRETPDVEFVDGGDAGELDWLKWWEGKG